MRRACPTVGHGSRPARTDHGLALRIGLTLYARCRLADRLLDQRLPSSSTMRDTNRPGSRRSCRASRTLRLCAISRPTLGPVPHRGRIRYAIGLAEVDHLLVDALGTRASPPLVSLSFPSGPHLAALTDHRGHRAASVIIVRRACGLEMPRRGSTIASSGGSGNRRGCARSPRAPNAAAARSFRTRC